MSSLQTYRQKSNAAAGRVLHHINRLPIILEIITACQITGRTISDRIKRSGQTPTDRARPHQSNQWIPYMTNLDFGYILQVLPGIILGFTVHEFAHAFVAFHLGDDTARRMGRYSLNPLKHIDPFGFFLLIIAGFGWAKPVMIDRSKLANPRRDDALIAVAGPLSNLGLSFIIAGIIKIVLLTAPYEGNVVYSWILNALIAGVYVNLGLFVFNLLPIPPLDGSHVLLQALNIKDEMNVRAFYKYGTFLLLGIIIAERGLNVDILPIGKAIRWIGEGVLTLFGLA